VILEESKIDTSVHFPKFEHGKEVPVQYMLTEEETAAIWAVTQSSERVSIFKVIWWIITSSPSILKLLIFIITFKEKFMNTDLKTTILGIIKGIFIVVAIFGINISPENQTVILTTAGSLLAIIEIIQGWFTNKKTK
jgi:hypothetical protein